MSECKICLENNGDIIYPCKCKDGIHENCLKKWIESPINTKPTRCEICNENYELNYQIVIDSGRRRIIDLNNVVVTGRNSTSNIQNIIIDINEDQTPRIVIYNTVNRIHNSKCCFIIILLDITTIATSTLYNPKSVRTTEVVVVIHLFWMMMVFLNLISIGRIYIDCVRIRDRIDVNP